MVNWAQSMLHDSVWASEISAPSGTFPLQRQQDEPRGKEPRNNLCISTSIIKDVVSQVVDDNQNSSTTHFWVNNLGHQKQQ